MQKALLLALVILAAIHTSLAGAAPAGKHAVADFNAVWQKGNAFYQEKQFDSAAVYYEKLASKRPQNAEIYFNLGNAYYRLNQLAPAILNYERALRIDPDNKTVADNLSLAQSRISNRVQHTKDIFFVQWWRAMTNAELAGFWAIAGLLLFIAFLVVLLARRWNRLPASFPNQVTGFLVICCCLSIFLAFVSAGRQAGEHRAVVMVADAPLFENPGITKTRVLVPEGTVVDIRNQRAGWSEVDLPDGRTGWISMAAIEKI